MRHNSAAGKHCVLDMHHTKSLDAFDEVLLRVHGAWGGGIMVQISRFGGLNYQI